MASVSVVEACIGGFGRWHYFIAFLIFLSKFPIGWHLISIVFMSPPVEFKCADNNSTNCNCKKFIYDTAVFTRTIVSEWDLVCEKHVLQDLVQSITMFGVLVGNLFFGCLSDRFGRKSPMMLCVIVQLVSGAATSFAEAFWLFLVFKFICCAATGGTMVVGFTLLMELTGVQYRTKVGIFYQVPDSLGYLTITGAAYYIRDWRYLQLAISLPSVIMVLYYWFLPESPSWCLLMRKPERAIDILSYIAKKNGLETRHIPAIVSTFLHERRIRKGRPGSIKQLCKFRVLRKRLIMLIFVWFMIAMNFYAIYQYIGRIPGDIFITYTVSGVSQTIGVIILGFVVDKGGRKLHLLINMIIATISLAIPIVLPRDPWWVAVTFGVIGMISLLNAFCIIYIISAELFPTLQRNAVVGLCSCIGRIGSILSPYLSVSLNKVSYIIPLVVLTLTSLVCTILIFFLPETKGCELPNSIEEAEDITIRYRESGTVEEEENDQ